MHKVALAFACSACACHASPLAASATFKQPAAGAAEKSDVVDPAKNLAKVLFAFNPIGTSTLPKQSVLSCQGPGTEVVTFNKNIRRSVGTWMIPLEERTDYRTVVSTAMILSLISGMVNVLTFLDTGIPTAHHTGSATHIGRLIGDGTTAFGDLTGVAPKLTSLMAGFAVGAGTGGYLAPDGEDVFKGKRSPGLILSALVIAAGVALRPLTGGSVLPTLVLMAYSQGLQNAITTRCSSCPVRTTHMTGALTDMGSGLGAWIRAKFGRARLPSLRKPILFGASIFSFALGGTLGRLLFSSFGLFGCLLPSAMVYLMGAGVRLNFMSIHRTSAQEAEVSTPHLKHDHDHGHHDHDHGHHDHDHGHHNHDHGHHDHGHHDHDHDHDHDHPHDATKAHDHHHDHDHDHDHEHAGSRPSKSTLFWAAKADEAEARKEYCNKVQAARIARSAPSAPKPVPDASTHAGNAAADDQAKARENSYKQEYASTRARPVPAAPEVAPETWTALFNTAADDKVKAREKYPKKKDVSTRARSVPSVPEVAPETWAAHFTTTANDEAKAREKYSKKARAARARFTPPAAEAVPKALAPAGIAAADGETKAHAATVPRPAPSAPEAVIETSSPLFHVSPDEEARARAKYLKKVKAASQRYAKARDEHSKKMEAWSAPEAAPDSSTPLFDATAVNDVKVQAATSARSYPSVVPEAPTPKDTYSLGCVFLEMLIGPAKFAEVAAHGRISTSVAEALLEEKERSNTLGDDQQEYLNLKTLCLQMLSPESQQDPSKATDLGMHRMVQTVKDTYERTHHELVAQDKAYDKAHRAAAAKAQKMADTTVWLHSENFKAPPAR